jgi:competence protein ComEC
MPVFILAFAGGAWLLQQQAALPSWAVLSMIAIGGLCLLFAEPKRRLVLLAAGLCVGFAWSAAVAHSRLADRLAPALEGRDIEVTGVVAALPQEFERGLRFEFDVEQAAHDGISVRMPRRLSLVWYRNPDSSAALRAGERWRFTVRLKRPHGNVNRHGFDYELWLLEKGIGATGYVRPRAVAARLDDFVYRPAYAIERWREGLRAKFHRSLGDAPHKGVLIALAVGDQRAIDAAAWQLYARTGVSHLMSISGLHVTMISGLFAWLVYAVWKRVPAWTLALPARKSAAAAAVVAALGYCLLAGFAVPAQRTLYMVAAVAVALYFDRMQSSTRVLSWALLAVLLLDPWAVAAPGFWLSFAAVAIMLYVGMIDGQGHWLRRWAKAQWAITVGLAPLLLILFQQVSLVSPLANAIAIPAISFVVTPLALVAAIAPGPWLAQTAHAVLVPLMQVLEAMAQLPGAVWQQHAPAPWTAVLAMLGIAWMLGPRGLPARYLGIFLLLPLFTIAPPAPPAGGVWIDVLDVGQGLAAVVRTQNHTLLYDTGPVYGPEVDAGNRIVLPYLRAAGVRELDAMMVTHEDNDHSGGALSVLSELPVNLLWSSLPAAHPVVRTADRRLACRSGGAWTWDDVRFEVLHPPMSSYAHKTKSNSRSCVLKISAAGRSVLLTGDIEAADERALLARAGDLRAEVMLIPHHGSTTSSTDAFVAAVRPAHAIAAAGYRNRFGHPRPEILGRYTAATVWRTDLQGAIKVRLEGGTVRVSAQRLDEPRYWRD